MLKLIKNRAEFGRFEKPIYFIGLEVVFFIQKRISLTYLGSL